MSQGRSLMTAGIMNWTDHVLTGPCSRADTQLKPLTRLAEDR